MIEIRIAASNLRALRSKLLSHNQEQCAVLLATRGHCSNGRVLLLVREIELPLENDYVYSEIDCAQLRPEFVARIAKKARNERLSMVFVHTHPGGSKPEFSEVDDRGEEKLADFLKRREQNCIHAAMVLSRGGITARKLGCSQPVKVVSVGDRRIVEHDPLTENASDFEMFNVKLMNHGLLHRL